jgi:ubiquitin-activating enzyme E1-like protein
MSNTDFDIPVVVTSAGAQPTPPATLLADLIAAVSATNPGYTANLPGTLIEDVSSTDVGALVICDTARVEAINSITPYGANNFVLAQLGQIYIGPGSAPAVPTNTSVYVQFTVTNTVGATPAPGYVIPIGFTVSDGTYDYVIQDGGVTDSNGLALLYCVSPTAGTWAVATGTVNEVVTTVPSQWTMTCTNPQAGITSTVAETAEQYRARVLQAGQAISQGMTTMLKTLVGQVSGVQQRLISVLQQSGGGWEIIVGGGDPYQVAGAIFVALFDFSTLVGSVMSVTNITQASPGQVTTLLNHGYSDGQVVQVNDVVGMTQINGESLTVTVVDEKNFTVGISTTGYSPYVSGGVVTPNLRNITVNLTDYPDIYTIVFVSPPQQTVAMSVSWNTTLPNFVAGASVAQLAAPAIAAYVNSITVGQPINLLEVQQAFILAVAGLLQPSQISLIDITVEINGVVTDPQSGTQLVYGDPESYFTTTSNAITVQQA